MELHTLGPRDGAALQAFWARLSTNTIEQRFFSQVTLDDRLLAALLDVDDTSHFAIVAWDADRIEGVARCARIPEDSTIADFAVTVADDRQGRGLGTALLKALVERCEELGIRVLRADVRPDNVAMLRLLERVDRSVATTHYGTSIAAEITLSE